MNVDLNLLRIFATVAETRNFRAAADRLDVTRSAVSQSMRKLEDALGISLVNRSTRSVALTEEGERLYQQACAHLNALDAAVEDALMAKGAPQGLLRVAVTSIAEQFLSGPFIADFCAAYPDIRLDVTVTDEVFDIVERGFDAGVRLGEVIERDMIAVAMTEAQREVVVATPAYFARHGQPGHPDELIEHRCIGWRPSPTVAPYRWEFREEGRAFDVAVEPRVTTNDMLLMIRTALAGGGITFGLAETFRPWLLSGELVSVLDDYLLPFPGFYLYYPSRRNLAPKLRALIDFVKERTLNPKKPAPIPAHMAPTGQSVSSARTRDPT